MEEDISINSYDDNEIELSINKIYPVLSDKLLVDLIGHDPILIDISDKLYKEELIGRMKSMYDLSIVVRNKGLQLNTETMQLSESEKPVTYTYIRNKEGVLITITTATILTKGEFEAWLRILESFTQDTKI